MQQLQEVEEIAQDIHSPDRDSISETRITQDFYTFLKLTNDEATEEKGDDEVADDDDEEEEEFSFMCGGANTSPISAEEAFTNGQIKPTMFPIISFNQDHLPTRPPVDNLFVETMSDDHRHPHVTGHVMPVESSSSSPETCKKSNSTGFSKIWRFKDLMGRSNSDGRDAFVFLNNNNNSSNNDNNNSDDAVNTSVRVSTEKVKKTKGGKTASLSAHEVYLRRSKAAKAGDERRRSYLPYRPGLMGFFTNVSGGILTKNVHPY